MRRYLRWFSPGLGIKRWLLVSVIGVAFMVLGLSLALRINLYAVIGAWFFENIAYSAAAFQTGPAVAGVIMGILGGMMTLWGVSKLIQSVLGTLWVPSGGAAETFYQRRLLLRGPKVAAIGGGTGIPTLLRGMKHYTSNIAAVVTVADDGGSSGRLRTEFGILPPGDIRNCLVALADTEPLMERLFQHRFNQGEGLAGHPFGNLFILAMTETTGDFYQAVRASSQVLAIRGRVMPSTLDQVVLRAQLDDGSVLTGESVIGKSKSPIRRIFLERVGSPAEESGEIRPLKEALQAIEEADVVVLGPGSLYTSIIPNLLVPGVADAIRRSKALKIYVCNVMTEPGETDGYAVSHHLKALIDHAGYGIVDLCVVNNGPISEELKARYREQNAHPVVVDPPAYKLGVEVVQRDLLDANTTYVRHSPEKLAQVIGQLFLNRRVYLERTPWEFFLLRQRLQERSRQGGTN
ncbi:MAG: gluconeogenesis factor YvcK family protein [Bacillota bacterium]